MIILIFINIHVVDKIDLSKDEFEALKIYIIWGRIDASHFFLNFPSKYPLQYFHILYNHLF